MRNNPYFSVVIPVYNREREIVRALNSCFRQSFRNFEVLVIDDASSDGTRDVVERVGGTQATLLRHERNVGVCGARNTGARAARGEWVLFLDSDDEYTEMAFQTIFERTRTFGDEVERLGFMYRLDTGGLSPFPYPEGQLLDYEGYLRWAEQATLSDFHNCIRRRTFQRVMLPEDRVYEDIYHLDFAKAFHTRLLADVVAVVHSDASNRCANLSAQTRTAKVLAEAAAGASGIDQLLATHGAALSKFAPRRFETYRRMRVAYHLLAGEKGRGLGLAARHLVQFPLSHLSWIIPALGLFGPVALARAQAYARRRYAASQRVRP